MMLEYGSTGDFMIDTIKCLSAFRALYKLCIFLGELQPVTRIFQFGTVLAQRVHHTPKKYWRSLTLVDLAFC